MSVFYQPIPITEEAIPDIINEAYFGKTQNIKKIIDQIGIIRKKAGVKVGSNLSSKKYSPTINTWPEVIALNHLLENEFGFKVCSVTINQNAQLNAYTMPISFSWDIGSGRKPSKMVKASNTGFRYSPEAKYAVMLNITSGLMFDNRLTDEEITALMMHEIGHNFSTAMSDQLGGLVITRVIIDVAQHIFNAIVKRDPQSIGQAAGTIILSSNGVKNVISSINNMLDKCGVLKVLSNFKDGMGAFFNTIMTVGNDIVDFLMSFNPIATVAGAIGQVFNWPMQIFKLITGGYKDEQFADAFPGMYGLGPDLTSALVKLERGNQGFKLYDAVHNSSTFGPIANLVQFPIYFMQTLFDEHPNLSARFKMQLDLLENEMDKQNLDPRMRKEIKAQIDAINKEFDTAIRTTDKEKPTDPYLCKKLYQTWLFDNHDGDLKASSFQNKDIAKDIDTTYARALESVEFE